MIVMKINKHDVDRTLKFCEDNNIDHFGYSLNYVDHKYELAVRSDQDYDQIKKYLASKPTLNVQSREEWLKEQMSKPLHEMGLSESGSKKRRR